MIQFPGQLESKVSCYDRELHLAKREHFSKSAGLVTSADTHDFSLNLESLSRLVAFMLEWVLFHNLLLLTKSTR